MKNSNFSGNRARQKQNKMTTEIKFQAKILCVDCVREKVANALFRLMQEPLNRKPKS